MAGLLQGGRVRACSHMHGGMKQTDGGWVGHPMAPWQPAAQGCLGEHPLLLGADVPRTHLNSSYVGTACCFGVCRLPHVRRGNKQHKTGHFQKKGFLALPLLCRRTSSARRRNVITVTDRP